MDKDLVINKPVCLLCLAFLLVMTACSSARDSSLTPTETHPPAVISNSGITVYFPRQEKVNGERAVMDALAGGSLVLVDNCIRLQYQGDDGVIDYLLVWPPDFSIRLKDSAVEIVNSNGEIVANLGEHVQMSGGEIHLLSQLDQFIQEQVPPQCPGPYWQMGYEFSVVSPYPSPSP